MGRSIIAIQWGKVSQSLLAGCILADQWTRPKNALWQKTDLEGRIIYQIYSCLKTSFPLTSVANKNA